VFGVAGAAFGFSALRLAPRPKHARGEARDDCAESRRLFLRAQVGVGYALLSLAVVGVVTFAGLVQAEATGLPQPLSPVQCAMRVVLSMNMAILGSLFFVANALRKNRDCKQERFDREYFWAGLWYRLGEAVLFTLVVYLFFHYFADPAPAAVAARRDASGQGFWSMLFSFSPYGQWTQAAEHAAVAKNSDLWMPLMGLLLGMFIKTGERIVFGVADKVFKATKMLLPAESDGVTPAGSGDGRVREQHREPGHGDAPKQRLPRDGRAAGNGSGGNGAAGNGAARHDRLAGEMNDDVIAGLAVDVPL
jgi:hypothetical protein